MDSKIFMPAALNDADFWCMTEGGVREAAVYETLKCPCGGDVVLYYEDDRSQYRLRCHECGRSIVTTYDEMESHGWRLADLIDQWKQDIKDEK